MVRHKKDVFHEVANWDEPNQFVLYNRKIRYFCMTSSSRKYIAIVLFLTLSILIGTLVVYFTSPRIKYKCKHTHRRTVTDIKNYRSRPQSVAIDHFNDDYMLDFVIVNTGLSNIDIFLGSNSDEAFQYHTTYSTGFQSQPHSVAVGNLDNQYGNDLAVANFGTNSILIFKGFGNGSFISGQTFSTGSSHPLMIAIADLNRDHRLDIAVLNYGTNSIGIYIASTDGSFVLSRNYQTEYDSLPKSFVIADLNNDDRVDIIIANSGTNNIGIFFGNDNGTFEDQKIYSTRLGSNPTSVAIRDVNDDQYLDIIVANNGTNNLGVFFGHGNGSFSTQITYSTGSNSHPEFVAVYDFNGDNHLDIAAIDSMNERVYVLPNNENGTFPLLSIYVTDLGSNPVSMSGVDFNNDSRAEVLITNRGANNALMLMGYNVQLSASYSSFTIETINNPCSIDTSDLNGDNLLDFVVVNLGENLIHIFLGSGNENFTRGAVMSTGTGRGAKNVILGDFNNDHQLDIVVVNADTARIGILLGYGDATFSASTTYLMKGIIYPISPVIGDVNNDNCSDIVVVSLDSDAIGILVGYCNGTFEMTPIQYVGAGWRPSFLLIDDFNKDTYLDLVMTYAGYDAIGVYFGDGTGWFLESPLFLMRDGPVFGVIASGDFNNDNRTDLAVSGGLREQIFIYLGYGNGTFASERIYPLEPCKYPSKVAVGYFNSDKQLDLAVCCTSNRKIAVLYGNPNGEFGSQTTYSTGESSYPISLVFGDFNKDNLLDMAVADYYGGKISFFMGYYMANFLIQIKYPTGSSPQPHSVSIANFNNDTIPDVVVVYSGTKNIGIQLGYGNGSFGVETTYPIDPNSFPQHVNVGDLNQDDYVDIVVADSNNNNIVVFLGNGDGTFRSALTYFMDLQSSPTSVSIANLNNDKWLDLLVTNQENDNLGILYGYNYATFIFHQKYYTGNNSDPIAMVAADVNKDDRLDIVVANRKSDNIIIFFGDGSGSFTTYTTYSTGYKSFPNAIAIADLNKDGCLDIIVGKQGLYPIGVLLGYGDGTFAAMITHSVGFRSIPIAIVIGDVNDDDQLDVIVADPVRNKVDIYAGFANGSLSLLTTYSADSRFQASSIALGHLNGDSYLDIVVARFDNGSVVVLEGHGNGTFSHQTTYWLGIEARIFSMALNDFNSDDKLDVAVTNTNSGNVEVLFGFGNGSFSKSKKYSLGLQSLPSSMIVNYFNDDDRLDIAVFCASFSTVVILFGTEDGDFLVGRAHPVTNDFIGQMIISGHFNNDSHLDLALSNPQSGYINIFFGIGSEPFGTPSSLATGLDSKPSSTAVGDFDHDNRSDIVVANFGTDNIAVILATPIDSSSDPLTFSTGAGFRPYALVVDHFTDDNHLDIAVISSVTNNITIFLGYGNGSFQALEPFSVGLAANPRSIAVTDFNNDHKVDLVIANADANDVLVLFGFGDGSFGNERRHSMGYDSRPYSVAVGDFDRDDWMDIAVANFEADYVEILLQPC